MIVDDFKVYKIGKERSYSWTAQKSYPIDGDAFVIGASVEFEL